MYYCNYKVLAASFIKEKTFEFDLTIEGYSLKKEQEFDEFLRSSFCKYHGSKVTIKNRLLSLNKLKILDLKEYDLKGFNNYNYYLTKNLHSPFIGMKINLISLEIDFLEVSLADVFIKRCVEEHLDKNKFVNFFLGRLKKACGLEYDSFCLEHELSRSILQFKSFVKENDLEANKDYINELGRTMLSHFFYYDNKFPPRTSTP